MKKFNITLRWRICLLTMLCILISSITMTLFFNINTNKNLGELSNKLNTHVIVESAKSNIDMVIENPGDRGVVVSESSGTVSAIILASQNIFRDTIILLTSISIFGGVLSYYISGKMLKPIKEFNSSIHEINGSSELHPLAQTGLRDEIWDLKSSFNLMMARLNNVFASQKRFNANVAHELKTPLAVIQTNLQVIKDEKYVTSKEYEETFSIVYNSIMKMNQMIEGLLDTITQENAPMDDTVKIDEIISDVAYDLNTIAREKQVDLQVNPFSVSEIKGNEILIYRMIYNLVENACKYNHPGGTVKVTCYEKNKTIYISVVDTGIGIPEDKVLQIFEPFFRIKKSSEINGFGLGLSLVKSVVSIHDGEVKVKSSVGIGTEFNISMPLR